MKAFPRADGKFNSSIPDEQGMDLRDYFATHAMQALIQFEDQALPYESRNTKDFDDRVSYQAYRYADAMMKAREQ
jgi:hypothetical protein